MPTNEKFAVRESTALLDPIFPRYPNLRGMNPAPEAGAFLLSLRSDASKSQSSQLAHSADRP